MGATGSRSSPPTETVQLGIEEYSKLIRSAVRHPPVLGTIRLDELRWELTVTPMGLNKETGMCDSLTVALFLGMEHSPESIRHIDISIEILDKTRLYTVFQRESSRGTLQDAGRYLLLNVRRRELEASSCICDDDSISVRCTVKERRRPSLLRTCWFSSKSKRRPAPISQDDMPWCHTLTVDRLSQVKASLLRNDCVYSRRFAVGGSRWYLKLNPTLAVVRLVRATKEDDETVTRAEFSFVLKGAVNVQSGNMMHTFDRASPDCEFAYLEQPEESSTAATDSLAVRCRVKVLPAVQPTAVTNIPATVIPAHVPPPGESVQTPLLSAMHG